MYKIPPLWWSKATPVRWNKQASIEYFLYKSENYNIQAKSKGFQAQPASQTQQPFRGPHTALWPWGSCISLCLRQLPNLSETLSLSQAAVPEEEKDYNTGLVINARTKVIILLSLLIAFLDKDNSLSKNNSDSVKIPTDVLLWDNDVPDQNWERKSRGHWRWLVCQRALCHPSPSPFLPRDLCICFFLLSGKITPQIPVWLTPWLHSGLCWKVTFLMRSTVDYLI